jgi:RNA polymerase sigma-70 factor (ECF subfamily)
MAALTMTGGIVMLASKITVAELPDIAAKQDHVQGNTSDEALVRSIADGDRRAMAQLYIRHNVRLYRFILRFTGNAATAEDLVSEVFLEVWRAAPHFRAESRVSTWLLAIARNKALSCMRRRLEEPLDDRAEATIEDTADDPESTADKLSRRAIIRRCLQQLSAAHRQVIDLVYYHDRTVDEIAGILGISPNTVKTRMFYARSKMDGLLRQAGVDGL